MWFFLMHKGCKITFIFDKFQLKCKTICSFQQSAYGFTIFCMILYEKPVCEKYNKHIQGAL